MPDNFDLVLDQCLTALAAGNTTVDECLRQHPQDAARLAPLLAAATRVIRSPGPTPLASDKRRAIEQRILNRAAQLSRMTPPHIASETARRAGWRWPARLALIFAMLLVVSVGAVTVSAGSLPDDMLYPVKLWSEQVSIALASPADQAAARAQVAQHRIAEFEALAARGDYRPELMDQASTAIEVALQAAERLTGDQQQVALQSVLSVADDQVAILTVHADTAPAALRVQLETHSRAARAVQSRTLGLLKRDPDLVGTPGPGQDNTATVPVGKPTDAPEATATPHTPPGQVGTTPRPSNTPKPDNTPPGQVNTPKPSNTPKPTSTVKPTDAPKPTNTPKPSHTPRPTNTPKPPNTPPGQENTPKPEPTEKPPKPTKEPKSK